MKKSISYMIAATAAILTAACSQLDESRIYAPDKVVPPVLNPLNVSEVNVTEENLDKVLTFVWDAADFGVRAQVNYAVSAEYDDPASGETRTVEVQTGITSTSHEFTYEDLNYIVGTVAEFGGLGVPLDTPSKVRFLVGASVGSNGEKYWSEPLELGMTVIYAEPRYPNVWVIGKYSNWDHGRSQHLFSFRSNAEYEGIIDFGANASQNNTGSTDDIGFKITGAANWNNATGNWGLGAERPDAEADKFTLVNNGGNIGNVYSKRYYSFRYNTTTLSLTRQRGFDRLVASGPALQDGEQAMLFNTSDQEFYLDATLVDGELGFAIIDGSDRTELGYAGEGILQEGQSPITATAGNYRITVNLNNSEEWTYELSTEAYGSEIQEDEDITDPTGHTWGLVGYMNNWGNDDGVHRVQADLAMALDGDYYVRKNVSLVAGGEFKLRFDNLWHDDDDNQTNFGVSSALSMAPASGQTYMSAVLVRGGSANISVAQTGEYDVYFHPDLGYLHIRPAGSDEPGDIGWGLVGSFTGWEPGEDLAMTKAEGDGQEYYIYEGLEVTEDANFKFRYGNVFVDGGDNVFGLTSGSDLVLNAPVDMDPDGAAANVDIAAGTYNLVLYPTQRVAYIVQADAAVNIPDRITWGVAGTMTQWADNMDILMTEVNGYYGVQNVHLAAGDEFRFRYGNTVSGANYGCAAGDLAVSASEDVLLLDSGGLGNLTVDTEGDYDLYIQPDYGFAYIMESGSEPPAAVSFGIQADIITEGLPDLTMVQSGNEFVCYNVRFPEPDYIRIRVSNNEGLTWGGSWGGTNVSIQLSPKGPAIEVPAGFYTLYFNYATKQLSFVGSQDTSYRLWYIRGAAESFGWTGGQRMTDEGSYLVARGLSAADLKQPFKLYDSGNDLWYGRGGSSDYVHPIQEGDSGFELTLNDLYNNYNQAEGTSNISLRSEAADGLYDIYFIPPAGTDAGDAGRIYIMNSGSVPALN